MPVSKQTKLIVLIVKLQSIVVITTAAYIVQSMDTMVLIKFRSLITLRSI